MKKREIVTLLAMVAVGVAAIYGIRWFSGPAERPREIARRFSKSSRTVTLKNCTLKRYGSANDGGYLMCENLTGGVQAAYSYGSIPKTTGDAMCPGSSACLSIIRLLHSASPDL